MADPLSFVASITAVATLAGTVATKGYQYLKAAKNCSEDVRSLMVEVNVLCGILERLVILLGSNGPNSKTTRNTEKQPQIDSETNDDDDAVSIDSLASEDESKATNEVLKPPTFIYECQKALSEVENVLNNFGPRSTQSLNSDGKSSRLSLSRLRRLDAKDLTWPLSKSRTLQLIEALERHKSTCIVALAKDSLAAVYDVLEQTKISNRHLIELRAQQEKMFEMCINQEEDKVLQRISPVDPAAKLQAFRRDRQDGTGTWLFNLPEMMHWLDISNEALWIYGIPGAGKTILSTLVVDEVLSRKRSESIGTAYFYIRHDDTESHKPWNVLGSLISQLARQSSTALAYAMDSYTQSPSRYHDGTWAESHNLDPLLHKILEAFASVYIMIDGLDECGSIFDKNRKVLINTVSELHHIQQCSIRTLVFSRDEHDIRKQLSVTGFRNVSIAATSADLRLFTNAWLPSLEIQSERLKIEIVDSLVEQANGMFMWVRAQIDYLQRLPSDIEKRKALGHLPPDLPQTYIRIFETIGSSYPVQTTKYVRRLLHWLVRCNEFSIRTGSSVPLATLCQVICIENEHDWPTDEVFPTPELVYRWLGCLIRKDKDENNIKLSHFTVREFLTMDRKKIPSPSVHKYLSNWKHNEFYRMCFMCINHDHFRKTVIHNEEQVQSFFAENPVYEDVVDKVFNILEWMDDDMDPELECLVRKFLPSSPDTLYDLWARCGFQLCLDDNDKKGYTESLQKLPSPLHLATYMGLANQVDRLLGEGVDPNSPYETPTGSLSPLHIAILDGNDDMDTSITGCISLDYDVNSVPDGYQTRGLRVSSLLLASGANIEQQLLMDKIYEEEETIRAILTPLTMAIACRKYEVGSLLLSHGADWNAVASPSREGSYDLCSIRNLLTRLPGLESMVQRIVDNTGHCGVIEALEQWRASQNTISMQNSQRLVVEAFQGEDWKIEELLETHPDIDINYIDAQGINAVYSASLGPEATLRCLLEHGADPNATLPSGRSALCRAVSQSRIDNMKLLLEFNADIEHRDPEGWTPLFYAAYQRKYDALEYLLDSGADVNATLDNGSNALLVRDVMKDETIFALLLARGINLNTPNHYGQLPLHAACEAGLETQVERLCSLATDTFDSINQNDIISGTPLYVATCNGSENIVKLFLDRGASINKTGPGNVLGSALMVGCARGHTEIVKLLLSRGASLEVEGSRFSSAQETARAFRKDAVLKILEEHSLGIRPQELDQQTDEVHDGRSDDVEDGKSQPDEDEGELNTHPKVVHST
ncbi:MAG: hypothetical protein Q9195_005370 [Heterodermia aff. obscurata]